MIKEWFSVFKKDIVTNEEKRRAKICQGCEHRAHSKYLELVKSEIEEVQGYFCNYCSCPLVAKIKTQNKKHICNKWKN